MKSALQILSICFVLGFAVPQGANAQCAMCKGQVESATNGGSKVGKAVNRGILYLLCLPFVLAGSLGGVWYYRQRQIIRQEEQERLARLERPVDSNRLMQDFPPSIN